jgi:hypothetical protein
MNIVLHGWHVALAATFVIWLYALSGKDEAHGDYDFGGAVTGLLRAFGATVATLVVWLIYFAMR